jgi:hypothetical protein
MLLSLDETHNGSELTLHISYVRKDGSSFDTPSKAPALTGGIFWCR